MARVLAPRVGHLAAEALQQALVQVSELVSELPDIESLDIDPLYAGETQLRAGGLRMTLTETPGCATPQTAGYPHMAIHPYPARLVQVRRFNDGIPWCCGRSVPRTPSRCRSSSAACPSARATCVSCR